MSSYILVDKTKKDKQWWNELVRTCAVIGEPFEIHCWEDEKAEMQLATITLLSHSKYKK